MNRVKQYGYFAFMAGLRLIMVIVGWAFVPFTLLASGAESTPRLWRPVYGNVADIKNQWSVDDMSWWHYLVVPIFLLLAYWSYDHWYAPVTIYFIFASVGLLSLLSSKDRFAKYWWMAFRNPTGGLKGRVKQPVPEVMPNPDHNVRVEGWPEAERWMESGIYWEYWSLKAIDWRIFGKHYRWFEKRIGWKFVDGNEEFFPTIQFGPRSS